MSSNTSQDDLNNHVLVGDAASHIKHLTLDSDHLYRHLTEVNGRDTRGGYIEGVLEFQECLLASSLALKISLVSASGGGDKRGSGHKRLHPNLLYMTRFDGTKRQRELEARAPMWKIDLEITDGVVYWWTESESQPLYKQQICKLKNNDATKFATILDLKDLHLTVITPLVRTNVNGIRVRDGLAMRKPMFEDDLMDDGDWEELVRKLDKFYTGKDGKAEMDRVCLQFDLHNLTDGNEELEPMCSVISYPIVNSKSRNLGILDLLPDIISAQKACSSYGRTIYLPSKFKLPNSEKEVYPRFVVQFHNDHYVLDERVRQPTDVKIFAAQMFIFKTPVQNEDSIRDIYLSGGKIFLEVYRPKDRQSSIVKHEFEFKVHTSWRNSSIEWCAFCLENPDKIGQSMEESLKHRLQSTGVAKPGTKRRKREEGVGSPESVRDVKVMEMNSGDVTDGPLFNELQNYVDNIDNLENIDIDDLVRQDIPDVLMGVLETGVKEDAMSDHTPSPGTQEYRRCLSPSPSEHGPPGCPPPGAAASPGTLEEPAIHLVYENLPPYIPESKSSLAFGSRAQSLVPKASKPKAVRLGRPPLGGSPLNTNKEFSSLDSFEEDSNSVSAGSLMSRINSIESDSAKPVATRSLISRINNLNKKHHDSASSDNDSAYKSQESFTSMSCTSESVKGSAELSDEDPEPKVSELTRKFGGAKKKVVEKIKSKISKVDDEKTMLDNKQSRGDCFPAFVFMLTPLAVVVLAVILNFFWNSG